MCPHANHTATVGIRSYHLHVIGHRLRRHRSLSHHTPKKSEKSEKGDKVIPTTDDQELQQLIERDIQSPWSVTFDDVAGLEAAKKLLTEAVTLPLIMPDFFTGIREPWKGVLLFGPPGTGKTLLAKAVTTDSIRFFNCPSSTLTSKYRGDGEKLIRSVFSMARKRAPSIVFFDEADALISRRGSMDEHEASRRFKSELLQQMDGVASESNHVMVLATSNCPWDIDEAMLRRFEKRIYIPLPDEAARRAALRLHLKGVKLAGDIDVDALAKRMDGYSGADIRLVCKDASMMYMRHWIEDKSAEDIIKHKASIQLHAAVTMDDFNKAMDKSSPSVKNVVMYEEWAAHYGCSQ